MGPIFRFNDRALSLRCVSPRGAFRAQHRGNTRRKRWHFSMVVCLLGSWLVGAAAPSAGPSDLRATIETYVGSHQRAIVSQLVDLLSIPNVASDTENIERNALFLRDMLAKRGFKAELLRTAGNPFVYGQLDVPGAERTILLYAHYDGQPVDALRWKQKSPFVPILRDGRMEDGGKEIAGLKTLKEFKPEWRLYARSAADSKSPIVALCAALDALKAAGIAPTSRVRVLIDGEQESQSPSLPEVITAHREKLTADMLVLLDGLVHQSGRPTVLFGARGNILLELTTYGPKMNVHSGHYGNWVPNPDIRLARLLASMKDDEGQVLVKDFYEGLEPLPPEEEAILRAVPDDEPGLMKLFGIASPEHPGRSLQQGLQLPSLNIRGISSAYTGPDARTIIPDTATAALDIRLVKETPAPAMIEKILAHIRAQGNFVMESDPDAATRARHPRIVKVVVRSGSDAYRTSPTLPQSRLVVAALERMFGEKPVQIRTSGATQPAAAPLTSAFGFPAVSIAIANFDNNQHAENENLLLGYLFTGVESIAALLSM
jgi:acetylornithine deacetylase/succinyl-diaminopimelate desuccinylase-like protein